MSELFQQNSEPPAIFFPIPFSDSVFSLMFSPHLLRLPTTLTSITLAQFPSSPFPIFIFSFRQFAVCFLVVHPASQRKIH
jgi:hypothetical protein